VMTLMLKAQTAIAIDIFFMTFSFFWTSEIIFVRRRRS
jgi:hypothetical protein